MWAIADLYGRTGDAEQTKSTAETISGTGAVQRGASFSWLSVLLVFFAFRLFYEWAK